MYFCGFLLIYTFWSIDIKCPELFQARIDPLSRPCSRLVKVETKNDAWMVNDKERKNLYSLTIRFLHINLYIYLLMFFRFFLASFNEILFTFFFYYFVLCFFFIFKRILALNTILYKRKWKIPRKIRQHAHVLLFSSISAGLFDITFYTNQWLFGGCWFGDTYCNRARKYTLKKGKNFTGVYGSFYIKKLLNCCFLCKSLIRIMKFVQSPIFSMSDGVRNDCHLFYPVTRV